MKDLNSHVQISPDLMLPKYAEILKKKTPKEFRHENHLKLILHFTTLLTKTLEILRF